MSHVAFEFVHHVPLKHPQAFMATMFWRREVLSIHSPSLGWYGTAAFCAIGDVFDPRIGASVARRRYFALTRPQRHGPVLAFMPGIVRPSYEDSEAMATTLLPVIIRGA